jgi:DNA-directed RNA polymerase specialized sigma24 family protein
MTKSFGKSHELDYPRNARIFSRTVDQPREDATSDDELVGLLDPREREVLLMHEVHGVALLEVASAVGIPLSEAERLLTSARNRLRAKGKAAR